MFTKLKSTGASYYPSFFTHDPLYPAAPGPPSGLEGEAVGSNGILLSWTMPPNSNNIDGYVIRSSFFSVAFNLKRKCCCSSSQVIMKTLMHSVTQSAFGNAEYIAVNVTNGLTFFKVITPGFIASLYLLVTPSS